MIPRRLAVILKSWMFWSTTLMNWIQSFRKMMKENWQRVHQREQRKEMLRREEMKWPMKCGFNTNKSSRTEEISNLSQVHTNFSYIKMLVYGTVLHINTWTGTQKCTDW